MARKHRTGSVLIKTILCVIPALFSGIPAVQAKTARFDARINTDAGTTNQYEPAVAMNRYGYAVVVWESRDAGEVVRVYGQILNEKGIAVLGNFAVDAFEGTGTQSDVDVAVNDRGHFVAVWSDSREGFDIRARMFYANGAPKGPSFRVNGVITNNQMTPAVAMDNTGNFTVTWTDTRSDDPDIYLQRYAADGAPVGGNVQVNSGGAYSRGSSDVFLFNDGRSVVVWRDSRIAGVDDIYLQRYDAEGNPSGSNVEVSTHPGQETAARYPCVAGRENGDVLVCWQFIHPSGLNGVYGRLYDAAGGTLKDIFAVNETDAAFTHERPDAAANPLGGWGVAWETDREGTDDIRVRMLTAGGDASGASVRINDAAGVQKYGRLSIDGRGIALFVWTDERNGNADIYGSWSGSLLLSQWKPLNVYAASGFDGVVPLTWDIVYGQPGINRYHISRSVSPTGPFSLLTTVNLTDRGAFGGLFRDWLDTGLENGRDYYYTVTAEASGVMGPPSDVVHARPQAGPQELRPTWAGTAISIDGIPELRWNDAEMIFIDDREVPGWVTLSVTNNADFLYVGLFDNQNGSVDANDMVNILFDTSNDGSWDAASPGGDGLITIMPAMTGFTGFWGTYPNGLGADAPVLTPGGIASAMVLNETGVMTEIALDLHSGPLKAAPGQTIGFGIWLDDPGTFYPTQYGYSGEWPQGLLRGCAATLGRLTLASVPDAVDRPDASGGPVSFGLGRNYPNPFNPATVIPFTVGERSRVRVDILDCSGRCVKTVTNAVREPGRHTVSWDGRTSQGTPTPSGVYLVRLAAGERVLQEKITLIR